MEDIKSKIYLSWDDIEHLVDELCTQITQSGMQIESIVGVQRGGLIPAVMISHRLQIPMGKGIVHDTSLIVDDICDSGETFFKIYKYYQEAYPTSNQRFACLHYKSHISTFKPTFYGEQLTSDAWLVYPWESKDADTIQDYLK
jgi:hypoxanthine phosphoribosyltransferase